MKYSRNDAKGRNKAHWQEAPVLKDDKLPRGVKTAIRNAVVGTPAKVPVQKRRKAVRRSVFQERQAERRKGLERWLENESHSLIETPENKRRNMIKAAWNKVIRQENYAKKIAAGNL